MSVRRVLLTALVLTAGLSLGVACGRPDDTPPPEAPAPAEVPATITPPPADPLSGTWWVLSRASPTFGLRINLDGPGPADADAAQGTALCFDWAGTEASARLFRASHPVAVLASRRDGTLEVSGPVPQVDAEGRPTGRRGRWMVSAELDPEGLPAYRLTGRLVRIDDGRGVAAGAESTADLEREFKTWSP